MSDTKIKRKPENRPAVSASRKEMMLGILLQNERAFSQAKDTLDANDFGTMDVALSVLWTAAVNFHKKYDRMAQPAVLIAEIATATAAGSLSEVEGRGLIDLVKALHKPGQWQTSPARSDHLGQVALDIVKEMKEESLLYKAAASLFDAQSGEVAVDLPAALARLADEAQQTATISGGQAAMSYPDGWTGKARVRKVPTGVPFLDHYLGGGHVEGEIYGFVGPFGSCKTTLAVMIAVQTAKYAASILPQTRKLAAVVSYEAPLDELRSRAMMYAAHIPRETLESCDGTLDSLNKTPDHELGGMSEFERFRHYERLFNQHLVFIDMTGEDPHNRGAGGGYVDEIQRRIAIELRHRPGYSCGVVVVDFMGAMIDRHMASANMSSDAEQKMVSTTPILVKNKVAAAFKTPVWLVHQMTGEGNARSEGAKLKVTDGAGSKSWSKYLDFSFGIGTQTLDRLVQFAATKTRRQPPRPSRVLMIQGEYNNIIDVSERFAVDTTSRRIRDRREINAAPASAGVLGGSEPIPVSNAAMSALGDPVADMPGGG